MTARLYHMAKRTLDLGVAFPLLLCLSPFLAIIALVIRFKLGSPILFRQERAGKHGRPFKIFKFRTMTSARDQEGILLPDELRLTQLGKLIRKFSLDELPQLLNVIKGEMSLVGPRPLHTKYIPRYSDSQKRRLLALPGITGLAQVMGRNALTWEEKFNFDVQYVEEASFALDVKILASTFWKVIRSTDISQDGQATMEEFMGSIPASCRSRQKENS